MTSDKKNSESNTVDFSNKAVWNRVFKDLGIIAFAGFVYYLIVRFTDFGIVSTNCAIGGNSPHSTRITPPTRATLRFTTPVRIVRPMFSE